MNRQELREECKSLGIPFTQKDNNTILTEKIRKMKMSINTQEGNITPEQIDEWKKKYKADKLHKLTVKDKDGNPIVGYLRPPGREVKATALSMYSQNKILECGEFIRDNCWLGGDERLKMSGDIADTAAIQASGIIKFLEAELGEV